MNKYFSSNKIMNLGEVIQQVRAIVIETGLFIKAESNNFDRSRVELKGKSDLVSYVDKETERILVEKLGFLLPEAGFVTEENTVAQQQSEFTWIIDPLDGTTNFVHGLPVFSISVGLTKDQQVIGGVVYEVNQNECFYAWKGGGAYLNGNKISVSSVASLEESLLATGFPTSQFDRVEDYLKIIKELLERSHGVRRMGSAAVDMAYVASGRLEGFFEHNLKPWDVAAGIILVKEAGGIVTDFLGGDDYLHGRQMVAAGKVHAAFQQLIAQYLG
jgi:myo-inositol-1(or 4)-monophosphatase